jgi:hypothetical protein
MTTAERTSPRIDAPPARKILVATGCALLLAVIVLVVAVLPAEYGIDPLGAGRALGLLDLADAPSSRVSSQPVAYKTDSAEFVLGPYETVEYTYRVERGASVLFSWQATGKVIYDVHGQPDGAPAEYAESFDRQESDRAHGAFSAPFTGVHGWYWENGSAQDVSIRLTTAGFYTDPREYFDGREFKHELTDAARPTAGSAFGLNSNPPEGGSHVAPIANLPEGASNVEPREHERDASR